MITLKEAVKFHGHLGPYLVLGLRAGELALKELKAKKHFGIEVKIWGASIRPKSCLVDGLQLSCGTTYGKGNITKVTVSPGYQVTSKGLKILCLNTENNKKIEISLEPNLVKKLESLKGHQDSEVFARELYKVSSSRFLITRSIPTRKI